MVTARENPTIIERYPPEFSRPQIQLTDPAWRKNGPLAKLSLIPKYHALHAFD